MLPAGRTARRSECPGRSLLRRLVARRESAHPDNLHVGRYRIQRFQYPAHLFSHGVAAAAGSKEKIFPEAAGAEVGRGGCLALDLGWWGLGVGLAVEDPRRRGRIWPCRRVAAWGEGGSGCWSGAIFSCEGNFEDTCAIHWFLFVCQ